MGKKKQSSSSGAGKLRKAEVDVDPLSVRFTHSRIRPVFTGCGRRLEDTIQDLVDEKLTPDQLPMITIIENNGFLFSLNNRRLYVLKHLRRLGLIDTVRCFKKVALERERLKYTVENCVLEARIMLEHNTQENGNRVSIDLHEKSDDVTYTLDNPMEYESLEMECNVYCSMETENRCTNLFSHLDVSSDSD